MTSVLDGVQRVADYIDTPAVLLDGLATLEKGADRG